MSRRISYINSETSPGGSRRNQDISLNLYSPRNGHWGTMMYPSDETRGRLYHVRNTSRIDEDRFFYDERDQGIESESSYGRSILGRLSEGERRRAGDAFRDYGSRDENIPRYSRGTNCQHFTTGGLRRLEDEGLISRGNADFFSRQYGRDGTDIASSLQSEGRSWVRAPPRERLGRPDARFQDGETRRPVGRLNVGTYESLLGGARDPSRSRSRGRSGSSLFRDI